LPALQKDGSKFIIQLSLVKVHITDGEEHMFSCCFIVDLTKQKWHFVEIHLQDSSTTKVFEGSYSELFVTIKKANGALQGK
jgi:hypothetical protein